MKQPPKTVPVGARREESGSALIIAATVLIVLSLLGISVVRTVAVEYDTAGAERASQDALYNTEAGIAWAQEELAKKSLVASDGNTFQTELWTPWGQQSMVPTPIVACSAVSARTGF